jgi:hypothetical protein
MLLMASSYLPEGCCWWPLEWRMLLMASSDLPEGCCWPWSGGYC